MLQGWPLEAKKLPTPLIQTQKMAQRLLKAAPRKSAGPFRLARELLRIAPRKLPDLSQLAETLKRVLRLPYAQRLSECQLKLFYVLAAVATMRELQQFR